MRNGNCRFHKFDATTHQCVFCGRWERGFAPKKEEQPKHECQVCCNHQCVKKNGTLVLHGYERPGHGWINGRCFGVGYLPYKDTKGLVRYLSFIKAQLEGKNELKVKMLEATEHLYSVGYGRSSKLVTVPNTHTKMGYLNDADGGKHWVATFSEVKANVVYKIDGDIQAIKSELKRVEERIEKAKI